MSIKSIWSNVTTKAIISVLIFWLDDLATDVSEVWKHPIIVLHSFLNVFFFKKKLYKKMYFTKSF